MTEKVRLKPDTPEGVRPKPGSGFHPWHFFVLASLAAATAAVLVSRQPTPEHLILISLAIGAAGFTGFAMYRTLAPLATRDYAAGREPLGRRSRAALEREKTLTLRAIKELEFDRAMGKVAPHDFDEMAGRLRARALAIMRQLEDHGDYGEHGGLNHGEHGGHGDMKGKPRVPRAPRGDDPRVLRDPGGETQCMCGTRNDPDARFCKHCGTKLAAALLAVLIPLLAPGIARAQGLPMPDLTQMSGVPLPVADLPDGMVSVRVIRGSLSNNVPSQAVELVAAGRTHTAKTDASGRAQFARLAPGIEARARTVVGGETIESQPFTIPRQGGIRLLLVATDPDARRAAAEAAALATSPPQPGVVVFGGESRIVVESVEDALDVYYLFDVVNTARTPISTPAPLLFELPAGAAGATVLEGSSPQATAGGSRVAVTGPFAPGRTAVRIAYRLPHAGGDVSLVQPLPAALEQVTIVAEKQGATELVSAQAPNRREIDADGRRFIVANGPALRAGGALHIILSGLPGHPRWPRYVALTLAAIILAAGAWGARRSPSSEEGATAA